MSMRFALFAIAALVPCATAHGVSTVRGLQRPIEDAPNVVRSYVEGGFRYQDFDGASAIIAGASASTALADNLELGGALGFANVDPDGGSGESGLLDADVFLRFMLEPIHSSTGNLLQLATGGLLSLPIGDDDLLQGTLDFAWFGGLRYYLPGVTLAARLGIRINGNPKVNVPGEGRFELDGEPSVLIGGGARVALTPDATLLIDLDVETERIEGAESDARLTPGINARIGERTHLRGGLAVGMTDGAPDLELLFGIAVTP